jgi:SPP1 family predicted phage head-tail adaptor
VARIGELDQMVQVQARLAGQDDLGQASGAWSTVATMWARVRPVGGREAFADGQMQATATVEFLVRHRSWITAEHRLVWRGEPYEIVQPPQDEKGHGEWLPIICTKGLRDGR